MMNSPPTFDWSYASLMPSDLPIIDKAAGQAAKLSLEPSVVELGYDLSTPRVALRKSVKIIRMDIINIATGKKIGIAVQIITEQSTENAIRLF